MAQLDARDLDVNALTHINDVVKIELGNYWTQLPQTSERVVVFRDRHARLTDTPSMESQATFDGVEL
ncbi:MAG: hypothetical protein GEU73_18050, partial [Chloroflexi bacterium]|nr:hypothetical protein [Chloroflexota bacterium]